MDKVVARTGRSRSSRDAAQPATTRDARSGRFPDQKPVTKRANISYADALRAVERYFSSK